MARGGAVAVATVEDIMVSGREQQPIVTDTAVGDRPGRAGGVLWL
jgi:hypothetical protein